MPKKKGKEDGNSKEVEELLSEAQDHMLLDLRIGSHSTRDASSLDGDLLRRFEALKKPSSSSSAPTTTISPLPGKTAKKTDGETVAVSGGEVDDELSRALGADLAARFAALKGISSTPSSSKEPVVTPEKLSLEKEEGEDDDDDEDVDEDGVSKKEVDKLIQWAMDAARLDPSLSSDDDDGDEDDDDEHVRKDQSKKNEGKRTPHADKVNMLRMKVD